MRCRVLLLSLAAVLGAAAGLQAAPEAEPLRIKLDEPASVRLVYEELGFVFDDEATETRREELEAACADRGSRRFGRVPRPILYVGVARRPGDAPEEAAPICVGLRPYPEPEARNLCGALDRPLQENRPRELTIICGPKRT